MPLQVHSEEQEIVNDIRTALSQMQADVAATKADTGHILRHLETLNGRVGKAEDRIQALEKTDAAAKVIWSVMLLIAGAVVGALVRGH